MSSQISAEKLSLLIGTANTPLIDARVDEDFSADSRLIPSAIRRSHRDFQEWREGLTGKSVVVICQKGQELSEATAAWLRRGNIAAEILEGGHVAWKEAQLPTVPAGKIPKRDHQGRWCRRGIDGHACWDTNARSGLALGTPPHGPNERGVLSHV